MGAGAPLVSNRSVTVKPLPVLAGLRIFAVLLGLLQCQAPQHCAVGLVKMWSVETNNVVGHWYVRTGWDEGARRPRVDQSGRRDASARLVPRGLRSLVPMHSPDVQPQDQSYSGFQRLTVAHHATHAEFHSSAQLSLAGNAHT